MKREKQIVDLFNKLGSYSPKPQDRGDIIRSVMEATSYDENKKGFNLIIYYLFGWTDYLWLRRGLVTVSLALMFSFVFQQFSIVNRIGQLEDRMVESNTKQLIRQQGEHVLLHSVIMKEIGEKDFPDSLMVADKDLRELIDSYSELQRRYQDLKRELYSQQYIEKTKNQ